MKSINPPFSTLFFPEETGWHETRDDVTKSKLPVLSKHSLKIFPVLKLLEIRRYAGNILKPVHYFVTIFCIIICYCYENVSWNETAGHNETVILLWVLVSTRTWVCKIYISSRELEAILLNHKQEKYQKEAMMCIMIDIFDARSAYFSSHSFSYEFGNSLSYFWRNNFCLSLLLIRLFEHFNLSILSISSHFT